MPARRGDAPPRARWSSIWTAWSVPQTAVTDRVCGCRQDLVNDLVKRRQAGWLPVLTGSQMYMPAAVMSDSGSVISIIWTACIVNAGNRPRRYSPRSVSKVIDARLRRQAGWCCLGRLSAALNGRLPCCIICNLRKRVSGQRGCCHPEWAGLVPPIGRCVPGSARRPVRARRTCRRCPATASAMASVAASANATGPSPSSGSGARRRRQAIR